MIEDVYEPLSRYQNEFKDRFAALTRAKFADLTKRSGLDVEANRRLVRQIHSLEQKAASAAGWKSFWGCLVFLAFLGAGVAGIAFCYLDTDPRRIYCLAGSVVGIVLGLLLILPYRRTAGRLAEYQTKIREAKARAWDQMKPLNRLYTWDITTSLIQEVVPRLAFDPYFTAQRLADLQRLYGWSDAFNEGKSILFAQSGVINGNPFLFGEYLDMNWGRKTYHGSLEISWTEWEEDEDGRSHRVTRYETLHAEVTKPIPVYSKEKILIYGNDAAPNLTFSREPSGLVEEGGGLGNWWRKRRRLKELEAFSRNLDDESQFTLMNNHEFEMWFHTPNRNNEVEFRLLFTPIAQIQMLAVMKDRKIGYGDDFTFRKCEKINLLTSAHLDEATLDTSPAHFQDFDYERARQTFQEFNERYFKDVYFSLAPLLAIPLYQQTRTHEDIWRGIAPKAPASFWENEAAANFHGAEHFAHPDCISENLLKTKVLSRTNGTSRVAVTAYGFRGEDRVDTVEVYGGDGSYHQVPVEWVEYLPVQQTREMFVSEGDSPTPDFAEAYRSALKSVFRRSVYSYLVP